MLEELDSRDEEQLILLEEEFRDLTLKEAEIFEQLTEVRAAKQRVRRLVAEKKNRYASIFKLPDELLVCIVEAGQQSSALASAPIEVLASHVSQQFRWAVIGAPSLWSSIELHWGIESEEARFAAYLDRAQACLLSVTLKYSAYGGKEDCDYDQIRNELTTVAKHISRIRQLVLQCGGLGLSFDDAITHFCDLYAPFLEYVDISSLVSEVEPLEEDPYASIFNGGAPCLKTLKLSNIYPECQTPWMPSLTILDLRGMHSPLVAALIPTILLRCPQLADVTLDGSTFFVIDPPVIGPILMASLRSLKGLRLDSDRSDALITGIVPIITAPALQVLQFSGVHGTQISTFFNLLPPSRFPALRSLTFANSSVRCKDCHHSPERIQPQALRHFIGLASLTMVNICHVTPLLEDLFFAPNDAADDSSGSFPSLGSLTLRYKDTDDFGKASWPKLQPGSVAPADADDPLLALRRLLAARQGSHPIHLRLPRSRFFTERDWDAADTNFEIYDAQPLVQALGHNGEDEASDLILEVD